MTKYDGLLGWSFLNSSSVGIFSSLLSRTFFYFFTELDARFLFDVLFGDENCWASFHGLLLGVYGRHFYRSFSFISCFHNFVSRSFQDFHYLNFSSNSILFLSFSSSCFLDWERVRLSSCFSFHFWDLSSSMLFLSHFVKACSPSFRFSTLCCFSLEAFQFWDFLSNL